MEQTPRPGFRISTATFLIAVPTFGLLIALFVPLFAKVGRDTWETNRSWGVGVAIFVLIVTLPLLALIPRKS
jgi:hypothetical protein